MASGRACRFFLCGILGLVTIGMTVAALVHRSGPLDDAAELTKSIKNQAADLAKSSAIALEAQKALAKSTQAEQPSSADMMAVQANQLQFQKSIAVRKKSATDLQAQLDQVDPLVQKLTALIPSGAGDNDPYKKAIKDLKSAHDSGKGVIDSVPLKDDVKAALSVGLFLTNNYDKLYAQVKDLAGVTPDSSADAVLKALVPGLDNAWQTWESFNASADPAKSVMKCCGDTLVLLDDKDDKAPDCGDSQKKVLDALQSISKAIPSWLTTLKSDSQAKTKTVTEGLAGAVQDSQGSVSKIANLYDDTKAYLDTLEKVVVSNAQGSRFWGSPPAGADLQNSMALLRVGTASLLDFLQGDRSAFETRRVTLSYFRDVPRLMKLLNPVATFVPMGGQTSLNAGNRSILTDLYGITDSIADLAQKQATLIQSRVDLQKDQNDLAGAQRDSDRFDKAARQSEINAQRREFAIRDANNAMTNADTARNEAGISDDEKRRREAAYNSAKDKWQKLQDDDVIAKKTDGYLKEDQTAAQNKVTALQGKVSSDTDKVTNSTADVNAASIAIAAARRDAIKNVVDTKDTFVQNLANEPYWYAPGLAVAQDPLKRIDIFGMPDTFTLVIRGNALDLDAAEDTIGEFDRPAPQAMLSVWSLQVNVVQDYKSGQKVLTEAMSEIEKILSNTRLYSSTVMTALQNAVFDTVREETDAALNQAPAIPDCLVDQDDPGFRTRLASMMFFNDSALTAFGIDRADVMAAGDKPQFDQDSLVRHLRMGMRLAPDPLRTTTLGETILVLVMASDEAKQRVKTKFEQSVSEFEKRQSATDLAQIRAMSGDQQWDDGIRLHRFWHRLGMDNPAKSPYDKRREPYGVGQREIVQAIQRDGLSRLWTWMSKRQQLMATVIQDYEADALTVPERRSAHYKFSSSRVQLQKALQAFSNTGIGGSLDEFASDLEAYFDNFYRAFGYRPDASEKGLTVVEHQTLRDINDDFGPLLETLSVKQGDALQEEALQNDKVLNLGIRTARFIERLSGFKLGFSRKDTNARVSAADEQLKNYIEDIQDDLDAAIIRPQTYAIRGVFQKKHMEVGVLQKTAILGADRHASRVDVGASAAVDLGKKNDILQATQQAAALLSSAQGTNLLGLVNGLKSKPEPAPELYALGTGGIFQVVPVFEPSGQAVRFQFDYMPTVIVRDPNGTTNANLPRIEHHSVVTEVQLSNLELREISRFESNSKLGVPPKKWGGIPLLNEIPGLKELPIIGWFTRKEGRSGTAQFSLLLGSSVTYPTIGDMVNLLGNQPPVVVEDPASRVGQKAGNRGG